MEEDDDFRKATHGRVKYGAIGDLMLGNEEIL